MKFRILVTTSADGDWFFVDRTKPMYTQFMGFSWFRQKNNIIVVLYE